VRPDEQAQYAGEPEAEGQRIETLQVLGQYAQLGEEVRRHLRDREAQQVLHLRQRDQHGDAVGESDHDADRHIANQRSEPQQAHHEQQHAGAGGCDQQVGQPEAFDDAVDDHDEGAGGSADLHTGASQQGDQRTGDDRGPEAGFRLEAGGDGEGHGKRQGHDADRESCTEVGAEPRARVSAQRIDQPGPEGDEGGRQLHCQPFCAPARRPIRVAGREAPRRRPRRWHGL
jgi:hypothetical protein